MRAIKALAGALITLVSLSGCAIISGVGSGTDTDPASTAASRVVSAQFIRVVDGDTIAVKPTGSLADTGYGEHSVRLLGIDAPEMHKMSDQAPDCGAQTATDHLEELLVGQKTVTLTFDPVSDHTDRYGRSLAYVGIDGRDLNLEQVAGGFAEAWYPSSEPAPTRYDSFRSAEGAAQNAGSGSWSTCPALGRS